MFPFLCVCLIDLIQEKCLDSHAKGMYIYIRINNSKCVCIIHMIINSLLLNIKFLYIIAVILVDRNDVIKYFDLV